MNFEKLFRDPIMDHCKNQGFNSVVEMLLCKYGNFIEHMTPVFFDIQGFDFFNQNKDAIRYWLSLINYPSFAYVLPFANWSQVYDAINLYSSDLIWLDAVLCWTLNYFETNINFKHYFGTDNERATDIFVSDWNWEGYPSVSMRAQRYVDEPMLYRMSTLNYYGEHRMLMPPTQLIYGFLRDNFPRNRPFRPRYAVEFTAFLRGAMKFYPNDDVGNLSRLRYYTMEPSHRHHKCDWPPFNKHSLLSKEEFAVLNDRPTDHPLVVQFRHYQLLGRFRYAILAPREKHALPMQYNKPNYKHTIINVTKKVLVSKHLQKPVKRQEHCYSPPYDPDEVPDYLDITYESEVDQWSIRIDGEWYANVYESPFEP